MHDIHELFGEISDKALDVVRGFTGNDKLYAKECWGAVYEEGNGANLTYTAFYGVGHIM